MRATLSFRNRSRYQLLTAPSLENLASKRWAVVNNKLQKRFALRSHAAAGDFCSKIAARADELKHHPELFIKYKYVSVFLRTNDVNGITNSDEALAEAIDGIFSGLPGLQEKCEPPAP